MSLTYHKTHHILHVQHCVVHRDIESTMKHIHYEAAIYHSTNSDDFHVKVAETIEEACKLIKAGFEYVTEIEDKNCLENEGKKLLSKA